MLQTRLEVFGRRVHGFRPSWERVFWVRHGTSIPVSLKRKNFYNLGRPLCLKLDQLQRVGRGDECKCSLCMLNMTTNIFEKRPKQLIQTRPEADIKKMCHQATRNAKPETRQRWTPGEKFQALNIPRARSVTLVVH